MKTLVVKIGTSTLVRDGELDEAYLEELARQVAVMREEGWRTIVVTSGAVRVGLNVIGRKKAANLAEKQAAAAIGQSLLMRSYRKAFAEREMHVAQLLLTRADTGDRRRFLNARHTVQQLFKWGVVPIVNENDTVATDEIKVGDNDTLASLTALVAEADRVVLLSDIDGFHLPGIEGPVGVIEAITPEIEEAAGGAGSIGGTGGMRTKLDAARIATQNGIEFIIAHGRAPEVVLQLARGAAIGTHFAPTAKLSGRKGWIAYGSRAEGTIRLNDCARAALISKGSSLLPIGIVEVEGEFDAGSLVLVTDHRGEVGRGLSNFSAEDLRRIAGHHSSEVPGILGRETTVEAIHRDDFSLTAKD